MRPARPVVPAVTFAFVATVAAALTAAAQPPPGPRAAGGRGGPDAREEHDARGELKEALREYYAHVLIEELAVEPGRRAAVTAAVDALVAAQTTSGQTLRQAFEELRAAASPSASGAPADSAASKALRTFRQAEVSTAASTERARAALAATLTPGQAARLLAFDGAFRQRVRALATRGRARERGGRPEEWREPAREPGMRGAEGSPADGEERPGHGPGPPPRDSAPPGDDELQGSPGPRADRRGERIAERFDETVETVKLLFAHEARTRLELDRVALLDLLPSLDAWTDVNVALHQERREILSGLRRSTRADGTDDAALSALVAQALAFEREAPARRESAETAITRGLSAVQAARFTLLARNFERELPGRLRDLSAPRGPRGLEPRGPGGMDRQGTRGGPGGMDRQGPGGMDRQGPGGMDRQRHPPGGGNGGRPGGQRGGR